MPSIAKKRKKLHTRALAVVAASTLAGCVCNAATGSWSAADLARDLVSTLRPDARALPVPARRGHGGALGAPAARALGGDAVIDVDDRDPSDDPVADGVVHPEVDWLKRTGEPPLFRVWTGPRFRFGLEGKASTAGPFACHAKLRVEVASNAAFTQNRWESGEISAGPPGGPGCYAEVLLPREAWDKLKGAGGTARIYYRARTWTASGTDERRSVAPGAGTYSVPPPFAVVNDSGKP